MEPSEPVALTRDKPSFLFSIRSQRESPSVFQRGRKTNIYKRGGWNLVASGSMNLTRATFLAVTGPQSSPRPRSSDPFGGLSPGAACGRDGSGAPPVHSDLKISRYHLASTAVEGEFISQAAFDTPSFRRDNADPVQLHEALSVAGRHLPRDDRLEQGWVNALVAWRGFNEAAHCQTSPWLLLS